MFKEYDKVNARIVKIKYIITENRLITIIVSPNHKNHTNYIIYDFFKWLGESRNITIS